MKRMRLCVRGCERKTKRMRKRDLLDEINLVVPSAELVSQIALHVPLPRAKGGRAPLVVETMLRIQFIPHRFNQSDLALEEALRDTTLIKLANSTKSRADERGSAIRHIAALKNQSGRPGSVHQTARSPTSNANVPSHLKNQPITAAPLDVAEASPKFASP